MLEIACTLKPETCTMKSLFVMGKISPAIMVCTLVIAAGALGWWGLSRHWHAQASARVQKLTADLPWLTEVTWQKLQVFPRRKELRLTGVQVFTSEMDSPLTIGTVTLRNVNVLPHRGNIELDELQIPFEHPLGRNLKPFLAFSKQEIRLQIRLDYESNSEQRRFNLKHLHLTARNLGEVQLSLILNNIDPEQLYAAYSQRIFFMMLVSNITLVEGRLTYQDETLIPHLLDTLALRQGQDPQTWRQNQLNILTRYHQQTSQDTLQKAITGLQRFIESPHELEILAKPEKPVSLLEIVWPRNILSLLKCLKLEVF